MQLFQKKLWIEYFNLDEVQFVIEENDVTISAIILKNKYNEIFGGAKDYKTQDIIYFYPYWGSLCLYKHIIR